MRFVFALCLIATGTANAQTSVETPDRICGGVEPFWGLEVRSNRATFTLPGFDAISYEIPLITPAEGRTDIAALTLLAERDTAIALIATRACSDTMSDIAYPETIELLTQRNEIPILLTGCCRVPE